MGLGSPSGPAASSPSCAESRVPGTGFSTVELIQLKIVEFAPMPSASVSTAITVNPGDFSRVRIPYFKSCSSVLISLLLFVPQRHDWIDAHRPSRRQIACRDGHNRKNYRNRG